VLLGDHLPALDPGAAGHAPGGLHAASQAAPGSPLFTAPAVDDASLIPTLDEAERMLIERAMAVTRGHKGKTCQILGISRPTLERKLQKYAGAQIHPFPAKDAS
jgi:two-component system response regulator AtoC